MSTSDVSTIASITRKLQTYLASDGAGTGLRAELRNADASRPSLGALSCVMQFCGADTSNKAERWVAVAKAICLADPKAQANVGLGTALRNCGMSELRLERLLSAPDDMLDEVVWRACRMIRAKRERVDFVEIAQLLMWRSEDLAPKVRMRIAQGYLRTNG